jgi:hypothetical protein
MLRTALALATLAVVKAQKLPGTTTVDCSVAPCRNGGVCLPSRRPGNPYICNCAPGFAGTNCETSLGNGGMIAVDPVYRPTPTIDFCMSSPCMNGGLCTSMPRGYQCMCNVGFVGENCQQSSQPQHPVDPLPPPTHSGSAGNAIPQDCTSWNDGCNTCGVSKGVMTSCTEMACFRQGTPYCTAFEDGTTCRDADCSAAHAAGGADPAASGSCTTDADCAAGFCRPTTFQYDGPKECVAFSPAGSSCGGMMPPNMQSRCAPELECVNTMAMMMDAPGTCGPACPSDSPGRDQWGNCIEAGCQTWFDGCNTCTDSGMSCTEMWCDSRGTAECRDSAAGSADQCAACQARQRRGENIACFNLCQAPVSSGGVVAGGRCADGFCENPMDCPQCAAGLTCNVMPGMMCAGTCYGTCAKGH